MIGISAPNVRMARNLDISLVRTFVAVADYSGMTAAANALNLTQSAVSQQIARLEASFGGPLFSRDRRGLRLTALGERLLGKSRRLLGLNDEIWTEMTARTITGRVRLGAPNDLVGAVIAPHLGTYMETFPQIEVSLVCAASPDLKRALAKGEIDLAIMEEAIGPSRGECLAIERLVWVGAKGGAAYLREPLPISMVAETCAFRSTVLAALGRQGREWRSVFENGGIDATVATVRTDLAVTPWLAFAVPGGLDILPSGSGLPDLPPFAINLHVSKNHASPAAAELARLLREGFTRLRQTA